MAATNEHCSKPKSGQKYLCQGTSIRFIETVGQYSTAMKRKCIRYVNRTQQRGRKKQARVFYSSSPFLVLGGTVGDGMRTTCIKVQRCGRRTKFGSDVWYDTTLRDDHRPKELVQPEENTWEVRDHIDASIENACTYSSSFLIASCK